MQSEIKKYLIVPFAGTNQIRFYGSRLRDLSLKALRQNWKQYNPIKADCKALI